jgi:hypothetical protein
MGSGTCPSPTSSLFLGGDELGRGAWMLDETMDLGIGYINENLPPAARDDIILAPTTF